MKMSTTSHEVEIISYLNSNARELCMLNNYKIIKQIFIKYNCILRSSAPVERMYSLATYINSAKINTICDKTFEYMVVLRGNMHYMLNVFISIIVYFFIILKLLL